MVYELYMVNEARFWGSQESWKVQFINEIQNINNPSTLMEKQPFWQEPAAPGLSLLLNLTSHVLG